MRFTVGSSYNDPGAWEIDIDNVRVGGQLSGSFGRGPTGTVEWTATAGQHQIQGTIWPRYCPYGEAPPFCPIRTSTEITYIVTPGPTPTPTPVRHRLRG